VSEFRIVTGVKRAAKILVLAAILTASLVAGTSSAGAATPCWKLVLNDWFVDGRIDNTYPLKCYTEAQKHVNEDAKQYSTVQQDIQRALLAAVRRGNTQKGGKTTSTSGGTQQTTTSSSGTPGGPGKNPPPGGSTSPSVTPGSSSPSSGHGKGFITRVIDKIGPSNAESVPTPLLVLAGIAILLLLAAGGSWFARRYQARRLRPAPVSEPPPPDRS
jgi:cobalamin biosynthesis Mg chelatase CobN